MMNQRFLLSSPTVSLIIIIDLLSTFLCSNVILGQQLILIQLPGFKNRLISQRVFSVNDFGAKGDGCTNDTEAFRSAWDVACALPFRSRIVVPAGNKYLIGPIDFAGPCRSKIAFKISGTIVAPKDPDVWHGSNRRRWLYFHGVKHLTLEGGGVINGMGEEWWARSCKINITNPCRHAPTAITFHKCKDLKVRNLMMQNSQQMHMAFTNCIRVTASHLEVIAPTTSPNTDGIHISASTKVEIKSAIITTGDDCISIVSNSSKLRIRDITCTAGHGISIGSLGKYNSQDQVYDVRVEGAFLSNTDNGLRIKTWQGGSGFARKISFRDVIMENVSNPIIIDQYYCDSLFPCPNQTLAVKVDNISFKNIQGTSATEEAIRFACSESSPCEEIHLEDIKLFLSSGGITSAFCWEARGFSSGPVYPPPCFSCSESFIKEKSLSGNVLHSASR
ncbi:hypothetical protein GIB67_021370 [Kingdonia uniflora]|uniref:endo-polygalacturonase n=1 Tax=Kingdonia uniflora TaxID=39325 RepID=A0A7J7MD54_9MAGN|nr:hypothetical protein GIB67_021370 [Kingdonia uniflora]